MTTYTVTETQKKTKGQDQIVRTYELSGMKRESVESFWKYLTTHRVVESYTIKEK
jgi:hypothetical protein